ncbi:hypothetical protein DdX_12402 [Ditylenchus destructor]|uniref:Uncharacterized protein n=1 Tax=Ditylenchus destructor TaxID=166010 RepID=A0AAD4N0K2_9BILA|nr:hypothetical protein DdX_12402 [Ditylenchus destructor]
METIAGLFSNIWLTISNFIASIFTWIGNNWHNFWSMISNFVTSIFTWIGNNYQNFWSSISNWSETAWTWVSNNWQAIASAVAVRLHEFLGLAMDQMPALSDLLDFHGPMLDEMRAIPP